MQYYEFLAIFLAPIVGLIILNIKYDYIIKNLILNYFNLTIITNLLTCIILYILKEYEYLSFTPSFFVKYSLTIMVLSILIALFQIILKNNVKVKLILKNEKK
ncbi:MAG: hypothetical protein PHS24_04695 [Bacilli bacterium]|nr:hypothetical protein [Bacilli bacterium]